MLVSEIEQFHIPHFRSPSQSFIRAVFLVKKPLFTYVSGKMYAYLYGCLCSRECYGPLSLPFCHFELTVVTNEQHRLLQSHSSHMRPYTSRYTHREKWMGGGALLFDPFVKHAWKPFHTSVQRQDA